MKSAPLILALETSGRTGSVAVALGEQLLGETCFTGPMRHSAEIFPAIDGLLKRFSRKPKEIEHVYISIGPGSFTGLRIAVAFAKSMHLANAAKIVAVDTLDVIAANAADCIRDGDAEGLNKIAAILDAKRGQFFIAAYEYRQGRWEKTMSDCLMTAEQFVGKFGDKTWPVWLLGEGLVFYKDKFKGDGIRFLYEKYWNPQAEKVYKLGWEKALAGQFTDPLMLQPTYLRKPDIGLKDKLK
jgi:tRNA threonylcarbamoyladenosine biosynthesis protein TsaB